MKNRQDFWDALDRIDGATIVQGAELENLRIECRYQAENHPDTEKRSIFKRAASTDNITRKDARAVASLTIPREPCRHCNDR